MQQFTDAVQDLPLTGLVPVMLLIVVGLILWGAGRRVLRACFGAAGLIIGSGLGWMLAEALELAISPWIPALVVGVALACLAALLYRPVIAAALAIVFGIAAPLGVVMIDELQGSPEAAPIEQAAGADDSPEPVDDATAWLDEHFAEDEPAPGEGESAKGDGATPARELGADVVAGQLDISDETRQAAAEALSRGQRLFDAVEAWWNETPPHLRPLLISAAIIGSLLGLLVGTLASGFASAVVSSFGGSLLWLFGVRILLMQIGESVATWLPSSATALLVIWLIISGAGVVIQWTFRPKAADKSG